MYKVANDMSPVVMNGVFKLRNTLHNNLRHASHFSSDSIHIVSVTELNEHLILEQRFGSRYLFKLKIRIRLMVLRKKFV